MSIPFIFKQYTWIIETIRRARYISLTDISSKWQRTEMSGGSPLARTTFNRHRDAILDMFGIVIECDRKKDNCYYIFNESVLKRETVQRWMLTTFSISNLLTENTPLYDRILLESIPSSETYLPAILKAMKESRQVRMSYLKYGETEEKTFIAEPYCLKLHRCRWYVVMNVLPRQELRVYSLDRIISLSLMETKFALPEDFSAETLFAESFGVVIGDKTKPEKIVLRAYGRERFALQDLPIHQTQNMIAINDTYADFELYMKPTADFKAFLAGKGRWVVVLQPISLAESIKEIQRETLAEYAKL